MLSIFIPFFSLFGVWVKFWVKSDILFQNYLCQFYLVILQWLYLLIKLLNCSN